MNQKSLFSMTIAFSLYGGALLSTAAKAQNAASFSEVSSLFGVKMVSSPGSQVTVSVDAGAYYVLNGSRHNISGVIGVYELFDHPTTSSLPGSNPFPGVTFPGGSATSVAGGHSTVYTNTLTGISHTNPTHILQGAKNAGVNGTSDGPHTWNFSAAPDSTAFGYEAYNKSMAIFSSHSLASFVFTKASPLDGFHVMDSDGGSHYIKFDVIPEGSSLTGFSCLVALGSLSILRRRAAKIRS